MEQDVTEVKGQVQKFEKSSFGYIARLGGGGGGERSGGGKGKGKKGERGESCGERRKLWREQTVVEGADESRQLWREQTRADSCAGAPLVHDS